MMFLVDRKGEIFFHFLRALMAHSVLWDWFEIIFEEARFFWESYYYCQLWPSAHFNRAAVVESLFAFCHSPML